MSPMKNHYTKLNDLNVAALRHFKDYKEKFREFKRTQNEALLADVHMAYQMYVGARKEFKDSKHGVSEVIEFVREHGSALISPECEGSHETKSALASILSGKSLSSFQH